MSSALEVSAVHFGDNTFSQSLLFEITEIKTGAIKHTDITLTILYIIAEKFTALLPKNIFSAAGIQGFLVSRKTNAQDALATVTW